MKKIIFLLLMVSATAFAQNYPLDYFRSPLDIPLRLAGTFGELRNNHFHAGIDIKTNRRIGLPVYATADGYISRIKVAIWGYGKVIYINHPNGYTTVYAHLNKFGDEIQEYVKNIQYEKESYETGNIFPKKDQFIVAKGQIIGYSGRTGGFVAPHLHYEIRNTKTEKIINPLLFGIKIKDSIAPKIKKLIAYPIGLNSKINKSLKNQSLSIKKDSLNNYTANRLTASGKIGFGINVYDLLGKELNKNGIYSLEMKINGKRKYYHDVETFSFSESKFINLLIDYEYFSKYKSRIQKTFREKENKLSIYEGLIENGSITINEGLNYQVEIIAKDFIGNRSSIKIPVIGLKSETMINQQRDTTAYKIVKNKFQKFSKDGVTIAFPKNTFYKDFFLNFSVNERNATIHKPTIPLDKKFTITFDSIMYNESELDHIYIANMNNKKYPYYMDTRKKSNKIFTTTKTLGKYGLLTDNQIPKIYNPNFKSNDWVSRLRYLTIKISDSQSGIKSYEAYIDNEWILMEYDVKKKKLSYDFRDKKLVGSKHIFKLVVSDNVGNTNTYNSSFYRK
ncbi:MAG: M23 family metallopeptidase [Flavobacteriaceae bacterium]|nr:M23 family metallopeptidase [Flavobacteriaceae bacterium]MDG1980759.1 M23 family metallopeptidase [Flavobacteriaceae bacterium]